jgi:hypothetical protein
VLIATYREVFGTIAGASAALTGLLFVAISVSPGRLSSGSRVISEVHAAAALLAFTNALSIALFGLVPNTQIGYPAVVVGIIGLLFTAAAVRSIRISDTARDQKLRQLSLAVLLVAIFGTELGCGFAMLVVGGKFAPSSLVQPLTYAMVGALLVGIARAWELVGSRDTGLAASLRILTGHSADFEIDRPDVIRKQQGQDAPAARRPSAEDSSAGGEPEERESRS